MPAGEIGTPSKIRTHTVQGTPTEVATELQAFLQNEGAGTLIHALTTVRGKNTQGLIATIVYELP